MLAPAGDQANEQAGERAAGRRPDRVARRRLGKWFWCACAARRRIARPCFKEAEIFDARVVDSSTEGFALEATGDPEKLDEFIDVMRSYGEIERARSGVVAMSLEPKKLRAAAARLRHTVARSKIPVKSGRIMPRRFYEKDGNLDSLKGKNSRHHRLRQPGSRARPEPARFRRGRGGRPLSRQQVPRQGEGRRSQGLTPPTPPRPPTSS